MNRLRCKNFRRILITAPNDASYQDIAISFQAHAAVSSPCRRHSFMRGHYKKKTDRLRKTVDSLHGRPTEEKELAIYCIYYHGLKNTQELLQY